MNYDCPRERANPVLDKFASSVCEHVAEEDELIRFEDVDQFIDTVGEDAEVLRGTEIVAMPCSHEGECMAVLFLFRQTSQPFTDELAGTLDRFVRSWVSSWPRSSGSTTVWRPSGRRIRSRMSMMEAPGLRRGRLNPLASRGVSPRPWSRHWRGW